jgi:hypothetical protein
MQDLYLEDIIQLRKPHACGGDQWRVVRLGTDVGLVCLTCGHRILLPRGVFNKRLKRRIVSQATPSKGENHG